MVGLSSAYLHIRRRSLSVSVLRGVGPDAVTGVGVAEYGADDMGVGSVGAVANGGAE